MKTRAQIYEREAAALLRDISMYQILTEKQLLRLHPGKDDKIRKLLTYLVKQGRIWWEEPYYCAAPDSVGNVDWTLFAAVWVLADFIGQMESHSVGDFPAKIIFFTDSEVYEIVYIAQGREILVTQALKNSGEQPSRYLVIVDSAEQIEALQIPNVNELLHCVPGGERGILSEGVSPSTLTRSVISQRITSILDDIQRLNSALYAMNTTDVQCYPDNYEVLSTDAALRAETITCRLRHLLYASTNVKKSEYLTSSAAMQGIDIQQRGGIFEIALPCLLPKRRQSQSTEYLIDPLTAALEQYVTSHTVRRFRYCVVCFSHIYCRDLPERRVRNYDNLEIKQYLDAVGAWLLTDDGGLFCDVYHTTELGTTDCTRMFIMAPSRFPAWLAERDLLFQDGPKKQSETS